MSESLPDLGDLPPWPIPDKLRKLNRPRAEILTDFAGNCSSDPDTRTVAITSLVLSLWQLKGLALTPHVPWLLLINAGSATHDPIDGFTRRLVFDEEENKPRVQTDGPFMGAPVDLAPKAMRNAQAELRSIGVGSAGNPVKSLRARELEERFRAAQVTGFGLGRCRPYSEAWHEEYGLLTGVDDQTILRLNQAADLAEFRNDVIEEPFKLAFPTGVGSSLVLVPKSISLSGSLPGEHCCGTFVGKMIALGLPLILLPHTNAEELGGDSLVGVEMLAKIWQHERCLPVLPALRLPRSALGYERVLRSYLSRLPATYEFAILQLVHQLESICERIACFARDDKTGIDQIAAICDHLFHHTLRGISISVASLAFFGRGIDLDDPEIKLLRHLRKRGATKCSALLGLLHLKARQRDTILKRLGEVGLVQVAEGIARATTLEEFTIGLFERHELPSGA